MQPMTSNAGSIEVTPFGRTPTGSTVNRFLLKGANGLSAAILSYGGILHDLVLSNNAGAQQSLVLTLPTLDDYMNHSGYIGALIGPIAGRLQHARIGDRRFPPNHGAHLLHSGPNGFHGRLFDAKCWVSDDCLCLRLSTEIVPGPDDLPGRLSVSILFNVKPDNTLSMLFDVQTKDPAWINVTHHAYFNLSGAPSIDDHRLMILSDRVMEQDRDAIPTGRFLSCGDRPLDFAKGRRIGAQAIDHDYSLGEPGTMRHAGRLSSDTSAFGTGVAMDCWTDQPSLHVYTGDFLDGSAGLGARAGMCFEAQDYPDAPNQPRFPSVALAPGEHYRRRVRYSFGQAGF